MAQLTEHHTQLSSLQGHPAHLFIGPRENAIGYVVEQIQKTLCPRQGCYTCTACRKIAQGTHHSLLWLSTETSYTLDDVQKIHNTIRFETDSSFFIIIESAERLNTASANSLLKSLEEPPAGYHFLLLVERLDQLLPTIRSRCVVQNRDTSFSTLDTHPLLLFFTSATTPDPLAFMAELESTAPSEQETLSLIDTLITHWHQQYRTSILEGKPSKKCAAMTTLFTQALRKTPMPGSSKLFWKNLFLKVFTTSY
jgi:DNA polymerase-3 subunit delta'